MDHQEQQKANFNFITFNGIVISNTVDVGGGFFALIIQSIDEEEFPTLLLRDDPKLNLGDRIAGLGTLQKIQNDWFVVTKHISLQEQN